MKNQSHKDGQFTVPKEVCELLGVGNGDEIEVEIKGQKILTKLASGTEVYGSEFTPLIKAGERIRISINLP
ncbi:MAG: AbrB/MazE/SpoVT family DNA-binding domain-containing protein [Anaerolineales bacterium]